MVKIIPSNATGNKKCKSSLAKVQSREYMPSQPESPTHTPFKGRILLLQNMGSNTSSPWWWFISFLSRSLSLLHITSELVCLLPKVCCNRNMSHSDNFFHCFLCMQHILFHHFNAFAYVRASIRMFFLIKEGLYKMEALNSWQVGFIP